MGLITRNKCIKFNRYCVDYAIPVTVIKSRYKGGETIKSIMLDYGITEEQVLAAINFKNKDK